MFKVRLNGPRHPTTISELLIFSYTPPILRDILEVSRAPSFFRACGLGYDQIERQNHSQCKQPSSNPWNLPNGGPCGSCSSNHPLLRRSGVSVHTEILLEVALQALRRFELLPLCQFIRCLVARNLLH
jgi:hypothetical protein